MKKLMIALTMVSMSLVSFAQKTIEIVEVPVEKYNVITNSFWSNWFVQVGADYNLFFSSQEEGVSNNPFKTTRRQFGFDVAVGKWFTPGLGMRAKFNGIWGKQVNKPGDTPRFDYFNLHGDALFNLSNMLCGYNETRVWNFIPYVGAGFVRNCSDNRYSLAVNAGILNTFRLSNRVKLNLEVGMMGAEADFDGISKVEGGRGRGIDKNISASVGFTINLGKTRFKKAVDVDALMALNAAQVEALNAALAAQQDENARLKSGMNVRPKEIVRTNTVTKVMAAPQSVFFSIGSSAIESRKEIVNLKALAKMVEETGAKLKVTGYADSATGSAVYNQKLSEDRANRVADELVKLGVSRNNLIVEGKGGVDELNPNSYNRRVIIEAE